MENIHYMISEAAKSVGVESHTLRYWEEELNLRIGRTEMGHRYYTKENIQLFHCINKLKDQGISLRELKVLIPEIQKVKLQYRQKNNSIVKLDEISICGTYDKKPNVVEELKKEITSYRKKYVAKHVKFPIKVIKRHGLEGSKQDSETIELTNLKCVLENNNIVLTEEICSAVTESLKKEISYMLDAKELIEEEHFRKLDATIRAMQQERKNSAKKKFRVRMRSALGYE